MKKQTSKLTGTALDWAVAKAGGAEVKASTGYFDKSLIVKLPDELNWDYLKNYTPSCDWRQGGPIIEREGITVMKDVKLWLAMTRSNDVMQWGKSYLESAMRCYVAATLGDEIDIPEELSS